MMSYTKCDVDKSQIFLILISTLYICCSHILHNFLFSVFISTASCCNSFLWH